MKELNMESLISPIRNLFDETSKISESKNKNISENYQQAIERTSIHILLKYENEEISFLKKYKELCEMIFDHNYDEKKCSFNDLFGIKYSHWFKDYFNDYIEKKINQENIENLISNIKKFPLNIYKQARNALILYFIGIFSFFAATSSQLFFDMADEVTTTSA